MTATRGERAEASRDGTAPRPYPARAAWRWHPPRSPQFSRRRHDEREKWRRSNHPRDVTARYDRRGDFVEGSVSGPMSGRGADSASSGREEEMVGQTGMPGNEEGGGNAQPAERFPPASRVRAAPLVPRARTDRRRRRSQHPQARAVGLRCRRRALRRRCGGAGPAQQPERRGQREHGGHRGSDDGSRLPAPRRTSGRSWPRSSPRSRSRSRRLPTPPPAPPASPRRRVAR